MSGDESTSPGGDHYGEAYYQANGQSGDRPALGWYARMARRYLAGAPYLDFGCGTGHLLKRLRSLGDASGFEISEYSAAESRATAGGATVYTSTEDIPTGAFRSLTAIHVVEHLDEEVLGAVLATWRRVLADGGRALVVTPDLGGRANRLSGAAWNAFTDPTHINLKAHAEWRAVFEGQGFRVRREGSDGLWNVPYGRLPRLLDAGLHAVPSFIQYLSGGVFLRPGSGESAVFVLERA